MLHTLHWRVPLLLPQVLALYHVLSIELVSKCETHQHGNFLYLQSLQPLLGRLRVCFPKEEGALSLPEYEIVMYPHFW